MNFEMTVRVGLAFLVPATNVLGVLLKRLKKEKGYDFNITPILFMFNFIGATIAGFVTSGYTGWKYFVDAIVLCGFFQGLITAGIATFGYDVVMNRKGGTHA